LQGYDTSVDKSRVGIFIENMEYSECDSTAPVILSLLSISKVEARPPLKKKQHPRDFLAMWALIKEDYIAHRRDSSRAGFRALAVHRFGEWVFARQNRISRFFFRQAFWFLHRYVRNNFGIEIMRGARIGRYVQFMHQGGVVIHSASRIGDGCLIRHCVTIGARSRKHAKAAPVLGNNVEVGVGAVIMGDIVIGENAVIGANAVVTTDVPADGVVFSPKPEIVVRKTSQREGQPTKQSADSKTCCATADGDPNLS
jgi:serine O-acetyltransferase